MTRTAALALLLALGVSAPGAAQELLTNPGLEGDYAPLPAPTGKAQISGQIAPGWQDNSGWADVTVAYAPDPVLPHGGRASQRIEVRAVRDGAEQFVQPFAVQKGRRYRASVWLRAARPGFLDLMLRQQDAPYTAYADLPVFVTPQWKRVSISADAPRGEGVYLMVRAPRPGVYWADDAHLADITGQSDPDALTEAVILAGAGDRIRRYRQADLTVVVRDARGRPVPGARVHVAQTRHAFLFGCNIFGLDPNDSSPAQKAYQADFAGLFNYATLPFYWGAFEPQAGRPDYARLDTMARWCLTHGVTPKGHPLVWHQVYPGWAPKTADAAIPLLHRRVTDLVSHYKGVIGYWDVVNEANSPDLNTGVGDWIHRDGPAPVVETAVEWAREAGQGARETFLYNDFNTGGDNLALWAAMTADGKRPDVVGLQSHMHGGPWPLAQVWQTCERFAQFGRPIHFTETTVVSGPPKTDLDFNRDYTDWISTPEGEASQADYVAKFYTVLFSHPSLRAITWWDMSDRDAWLGAPAGLVRKDMTPKPAYERLKTLIHQTWWTDAQGRADGQGRYRVHAFYGDYRVTADDGHGHVKTQTFSWPEAAGPKTVTLQWVGARR